MTREHDLLEDIKRDLRAILRLLIAALTPTPSPATIVLTPSEGTPMSTLSLNAGQTDTTAVNVGDASGNIITGDVLDPGATAVSDTPSVATAVLSPDQTSILVTAVSNGTANVTVTGTFGGATLTPGTLAVTVAAAVDQAAEIVLTPGTAQSPGGTPITGTAVLDPGSNLPLYAWDGTTAAATGSFTAVTDVTGPNAEKLYTFSGDTTPTPTGVQAGYALFVGTPGAPVSSTGHAPA